MERRGRGSWEGKIERERERERERDREREASDIKKHSGIGVWAR
jgi:hypothetical protein